MESNPLRFVRFRALCDASPRLRIELVDSAGNHGPFDQMASLKPSRPDLNIIVTATGMDEETILKAIAAGGTGFRVWAGHRVVNQGYVGTAASALHVHRALVARANFARGRVTFTDREGKSWRCCWLGALLTKSEDAPQMSLRTHSAPDNCFAGFAIGGATAFGFALVPELFSFGQSQFHFHAAVLEVHASRYQGEAALLGFSD